MAQYPTIRTGLASSIESMDDRRSARSTNGDPRFRVMWDTPKAKITLVHPALTVNEVNLVLEHYLDHRNSTFNVVFEGVTFNAFYSTTPKRSPVGGGLWDVTSELEEV